MNNLFLIVALPFIFLHLVYNIIGPNLSISYILNFAWQIILAIPLLLNHFGRYNISRHYSILVPLMMLNVVYILHGPGMRLETTYVMVILASFYFYGSKKGMYYALLALLMYCVLTFLFATEILVQRRVITPAVPLFYIGYSLANSVVMTVKILNENSAFNLLTTSQKNQLVDKNQELEMFNYLASHDLKSQVRNIHSFATLIERDLKKDRVDSIPSHLKFLQSNSQQLADLLRDISLYSSSSRQEHFSGESFLLDEAVQKVKEILSEEIKAKNVNITTDYSRQTRLVGSLSEWILILKNLVENGIKYNSSSSPQVKISATKNRDDIRLYITDNGIGIAPEYKEKVFRFFQRLHSSSEYNGTGLGLALCQKLVESNNGRIWVESEEGKGSTFSVSIPSK